MPSLCGIRSPLSRRGPESPQPYLLKPLPKTVATHRRAGLDIDELRERIAAAGSPDHMTVYGYVITTVELRDGLFDQTGSGPNFDGGLITLCTCKHDLRARMHTEEWLKNQWIAGFTSWDVRFGKQDRKSVV